MIQPALRSVQTSEMVGPRSLAERLAAEVPIRPKPEPTVSTMAARFAPDALRATKAEPERPFAGDATLPAWIAEAPRGGFPARGVFIVLTAVAIAPAAILAGLLWFGAIHGSGAALVLSGGRTSPNQQAAVAAAPLLRPAPPAPEIALTAPEEISAKAGDEVGFAITIDAAEALPPRSAITVRGLPKGAAFSEGRPYGNDEWSLGADEIAGLVLRLPADHTGPAQLRVELVAADGAVLAGAATRLDIAPNPTAGLVVREDEADRVADLMDHGNKMIAVGYLAGARAYFKRAAEAGSGEAALALGATYDPDFIAALGVQGIKPDPTAARDWYDRAAALGVTDRDTRLAGLKQDWAQTPAEAAKAEPQEAAPAPAAPQKDASEAEKPGPFGRLVAAAAELTSKEQWVKVTSAVNVRADGSSDGKIIKVVQAGTKLRVKGREGNWIQVANPATSEEGWIYTRFLKETDAP